MQATVGITAGLLTIAGASYTISRHLSAPPDRGDVLAVVRDATGQPLRGATVEIHTRKNALVTMLTPDGMGRARYTVKEGHYRLKVTHPKLAPETRQVHVRGGQIAEVHVRLRPVPPPTPPRAPEPRPERFSFIKRLFQ